jgi:hypothetical protein
MAKVQFDASNIAPSSTGFDPIPPGWYATRIVKSEMKETKARDGHYLSCEAVITRGPFEGRRVFPRFNLDNKNPKAVQIAESQFADLVRACGKIAIDDSEELHGIEHMSKIKIKPASGDYEAGNEVVGFKAIDDDDTEDADPPENPLAKSGGKSEAKGKTSAPWG